MRQLGLIVAALFLFCAPAGSQQSQQKPSEPPRATVTFDPSAIKRQAAQLAEFRTLLADPDPNVRLLTMREAIRAGDTTQRQMAIEAGLASNESLMIEIALRGILTTIQQIVIEFTDADGKSVGEERWTALRLTVAKYNQDTGQIEGTSDCWGNPTWSGQLQGTVFTFNSANNLCNANLTWKADTGDFRGRVFAQGAPNKFNPNGVWKPR